MAYRGSLFSTVRHCQHHMNITITCRVPLNHFYTPKPVTLSICGVTLPSRGFKTTSTEHPAPVFDQDEKILEKVIKKRTSDLPESLANPYEKPVRKCILCEQQIVPSYKNVKLLYQFVSPYTGMVYPRNVTGLCKQMQTILEREVSKARSFGWMAYYLKEVEFLKDPKLCDVERPIRPHKY